MHGILTNKEKKELKEPDNKKEEKYTSKTQKRQRLYLATHRSEQKNIWKQK